MRKPIAAIGLLAAIFTSCKKERPFSYEYIITNNCDTTITVQVRRDRDSTFVINKGRSERIFFAYRYEKAKLPTEKALSVEFDTIIIRKYHIPSQHDYMKSERWVFNKYSDVLARYTATVDDAEF